MTERSTGTGLTLLLAEAMAATGLQTKRVVVEAGLRLLVRHKRQADARHLLGRIQWEGDLHQERLDEAGDAESRPSPSPVARRFWSGRPWRSMTNCEGTHAAERRMLLA